MQWIGPPRDSKGEVVLSRNIELPRARSARLFAVADFCDAEFEVNGERVATRRAYGKPVDVDVVEWLKEGRNELRVVVRPVDGPTAVCVRLDLELADGSKRTIVSDKTWRIDSVDGGDERGVETFGAVARFPYGDRNADISISPLDDYTQWKRAQGDAEAANAATFDLLDGYEIDLVHAATDDEGSWVAMTFDPKGRVIIAREKRGLLRLKIPDEPLGGRVPVEVIDDTLRECRGLAFRDGDLYAMANVDHSLFRLRDTDGDDRFDEVKKLSTLEGDNGHGRNQLATRSLNGRLYGIFGDSVFEPEGDSLVTTPSRPTPAERERSGFLASLDTKEKTWSVYARGLRNPFGVAFNRDREPFTYDADAEYDMGSPWYRPTRVLHIVRGGDYGWRRVTRQWPPYDPDRPDMPPATLDIGKGSPTAVEFGYGSTFPPTYREALYVLDWAYGRILAVHLSPRGASYAARAETFLRGRPANVTDLDFGPDGAMYFVTGGRGTQSALYRVRYAGEPVSRKPPTEQQRDRKRHADKSRGRRSSLAMNDGSVEKLATDSNGVAAGFLAEDEKRILLALRDPDPFIRHAARTALERVPVEKWADHALEEADPTAAAESLLALSRMGSDEHRPRIVKRIADLGLGNLPERERLTLLFVLDRCLGDEPPRELANEVLDIVDPLYPGESPEWNRRASLLLERLPTPRFVERTLPLLLAAESQEERMHYLFVLRDVHEGWTDRSRRTYFRQLRRFDEFVGGEGMPTFRQLTRTTALEAVPESERDEYEALLQLGAPPEDVPTRTEIVRKWTFADLSAALPGVASGRDYEGGRRAFVAAKCSVCHRVEGRGGVLGPDLAAVSRRFTPRDVLVSILEPSKVVSEKYRATTFVLEDGRVVTGRVVPGDYRAPELSLAVGPPGETKVVTFPKSAVEEHRESEISPMPAGLLNVLTADEILDLLAYLQSGGDRRHPAFQSEEGGRSTR